jgi:DNA-binding NarL/FixJ family response regulator
METIRVLIADELVLVRAGFRQLLKRIPGVEVVAEAGNGTDALEMAQAHSPDVVLTAVSLPGMDGIQLTARLREALPSVRVVVVSGHTGQEYVSRALQAGAAGYVSKAAPPSELEQAIRMVRRGQTYLSPIIAKEPRDYARLMEGSHSLLEKLTPRQREVLRLIGEGRSTMQIAKELGISHKTVETHRALLMNKLHTYEVAGLVRCAIRAGLVKPDVQSRWGADSQPVVYQVSGALPDVVWMRVRETAVAVWNAVAGRESDEFLFNIELRISPSISQRMPDLE